MSTLQMQHLVCIWLFSRLPITQTDNYWITHSCEGGKNRWSFSGICFGLLRHSLSFKMAGDESGTTLGQPHLSKQDLSSLVSHDTIDFSALSLSYQCTDPLKWLDKRSNIVLAAGFTVPPPGTRRQAWRCVRWNNLHEWISKTSGF